MADETADGTEAEKVAEEEAEEARQATRAAEPVKPSASEVADHNCTHLPFRSWCPHCAKCRKDNLPHRKVPESEWGVQEVSFDYCFIRRREETQTETVLIMKDRASRAIRAWLLRHKGVCRDEAVDIAVEGIKSLGYSGRVQIKVDNEEAILALRNEVIQRLGSVATPVDIPRYESQSNGSVENRECCQVLQRAFEGALGCA